MYESTLQQYGSSVVSRYKEICGSSADTTEYLVASRRLFKKNTMICCQLATNLLLFEGSRVPVNQISHANGGLKGGPGAQTGAQEKGRHTSATSLQPIRATCSLSIPNAGVWQANLVKSREQMCRGRVTCVKQLYLWPTITF